MFGKVKQWFGIEGVKMELELPDAASKKDGYVEGTVIFTSMTAQEVQGIQLKIIEVYTLGRGKEKRTMEYELGRAELYQTVQVPVNQAVSVNFKLPFELLKSEMDEMGDKNLVLSGVAKLAKAVRGVHSTYRIEGQATVKGTHFSPFSSREITLK